MKLRITQLLLCLFICHITAAVDPEELSLDEKTSILVSGLDSLNPIPSEHSHFVAGELRQLGEPVLPILIDALEYRPESEDRIDWGNAARALELLGDFATNRIEQIAALAMDSTRLNMAHVVFRSVGTDHLNLIRPYLESKNPENVTTALSIIGTSGQSALDFESELMALTESENEEIQFAAFHAIQRSGIQSAEIERLVLRILNHDAPLTVYGGLTFIVNWEQPAQFLIDRIRDIANSPVDLKTRSLAKAILARLGGECSLTVDELFQTGFSYNECPQRSFSLKCLENRAEESVPRLMELLLDENENAVKALVGLNKTATNLLPRLAEVVIKEPEHPAWHSARIVYAGIGKDHLEILKDNINFSRPETLRRALEVLGIGGRNSAAIVLEDELIFGIESENAELQIQALRAIAGSGIHSPRIEGAVCDKLSAEYSDLVSEALNCLANWASISVSNLEKLKSATNHPDRKTARQATSHLWRFQKTG